MAIAFGAAGATSTTATSSCTPSYPAVSAGDYLLLTLVTKYADRTHNTPSGWTALGSVSGGAGTDGTTDEGQVKLSVYGKQADGTESGTLTVTVSGGTANVISGRIYSLTKGGGEMWDVVGSLTASDNTAGTDLVFAYGSDPGITANDWLVTAWAINSDAYTHTHALTCSGLSSITTASRGNVAVTSGAHARYGFVTHAIGAGTSSGVATYTNTASGSATNAPAGASVLVRLRVSGGGGGGTIAPISSGYHLRGFNR